MENNADINRSHRGRSSHVTPCGQARPCSEVSLGLEGPQGCRMRMPGKPGGGAQKDEPVRELGPRTMGTPAMAQGEQGPTGRGGVWGEGGHPVTVSFRPAPVGPPAVGRSVGISASVSLSENRKEGRASSGRFRRNTRSHVYNVTFFLQAPGLGNMHPRLLSTWFL